jgi:glycosyltransferase involved in cell wall biosynthesis
VPGPAQRLRSGGKRLLERLSAERSLRWRRPPALRATGAGSGRTVYYLCPDYPTPSGGIRAIYRHVDILNEAGIEAAVLHHRDGFTCDWFEHRTRVLGAPSARLAPADVLMVPEVYGPYLDRLPRQPRIVLFNQNAYMTYEHLPAGSQPLYEVFEAALTVSSDSAELLRFAFPALEVAVVPNGIDPELFHPAAEAPLKRLALMPRKRPQEAATILRLLGERLRDWEVVKIEGASERETAALLRSSPLFLALGKQEGFGLPAAEAMASGCYVIGFSGFGGRDLFDPSCSAPVEDGDVLGAARAVATALERYEREPEALRAIGAAAGERVRERYSPQRQAEELVAFHRRLQ